MFILWNHTSAIFYEDLHAVLHTFPKLSNEHIKLTPCSKMIGTLAAQVHISVRKVLLAYSPPKAAATARFCSLMD